MLATCMINRFALKFIPFQRVADEFKSLALCRLSKHRPPFPQPLPSGRMWSNVSNTEMHPHFLAKLEIFLVILVK
jgi:hypothetical protein